MNPLRNKMFIASLVFGAAAVAPLTPSRANPLPGETLKFSQQPLAGTVITNTTGTNFGTYYGHDEPSTAYLQSNGTYTGGYFADDFADLVSTPVVHVKWWGSYPGTSGLQNNPTNTAQKFLIAFESDVPALPGSVSHPDITKPPLLSQIVTRAALTPGSGTFDELAFATDPNSGEVIYQYNAELAVPFNEQANTVYWLKIVALDDSQTVPPAFSWGWHNRDYTIKDTLASNVPSPGEFDESGGNYVTPIWHFQDDAVRGGITLTPSAAPGVYTVFQNSFSPSLYVDGLDGPGGTAGFPGISQFSQDLAFELYTTVPEPASFALLAAGGALVLGRRTRLTT